MEFINIRTPENAYKLLSNTISQDIHTIYLTSYVIYCIFKFNSTKHIIWSSYNDNMCLK